MILLKKLAISLRIFVLLLCLPLAGCFDITQEMWVFDDGRGRMTTELGLHEQLIMLQGNRRNEDVCDNFFEEKSTLGQRDGVESVQYRSYKEGGVLFCVSDITVSDFTMLAVLQNESFKGTNIDAYMDDFQAEFSLKKLKDGKGYFRQHIRNRTGDESRPKFEAQTEQFTNAIMGRMMTGRYWSVTLHTPNLSDTSGKSSEDNKTVSWRVPLYDLLLDDNYAYDMQATFEVNVPWYKKLWNWII